MSSLRSFRHRLSRAVFAVGLGLLLCEGGLRLAAWGTRLATGREVLANGPSAPGLHVLCVGDSNTYGWAEEGSASYPSQLEILLDERVPGGPHRVVNLGMPGMNSRQVVAQMPAALERYHPDVVLALVGFNNRWSWSPASAVQGSDAPWYEDLRLVRLGRLLTHTFLGSADRRERAAARHLPGDFPVETRSGGRGGTVVGLDREGREVRYDAQTREEELVGHEFEDSIAGDLRELASILRARDTALVLLTYCSDEADYGHANRAIRRAAAEFDLPLVDAQAAIGATCSRAWASTPCSSPTTTRAASPTPPPPAWPSTPS